MKQRYSGRVVATLVLLIFVVCANYALAQDSGFSISSAQQDSSVDLSAESEVEVDVISPLKISLNVSEVRLDVVVVDSKGNPITDLTADDFEIYQDNMPQETSSSIYISTLTDSRKNVTQLQNTMLKEDDIRRTIVFLVNNRSMETRRLIFSKTLINSFVEKQMQPGDMVAVVHTGYGSSALNMFSSDKRQIRARVDGIPFMLNLLGEPVNPRRAVYGDIISSISYCIRAMNDMPGRKHLFVISSSLNAPQITLEYLADSALRAGVVIHTMDDAQAELETPSTLWTDRQNTLSDRTGGIGVKASYNFIPDIGKDANNLLTGYYLISYIPPSDTFAAEYGNKYRRVVVNVKREGAVVHTRDGFYGIEKREAPPDLMQHPLLSAVIYPFKYNGIDVSMAAGYIKDDKAGYLIRSWIHVDAKDLNIVETGEGIQIDLEALCLTSDIKGEVHDTRHVRNIEFPEIDINNPDNIAWVRKHGVRFSMLLPVKKPGFYTVHVSVQDTKSGNVGSAYQVVEIPDLKKEGMALSNIFMITGAEDIAWMYSDAVKELAKEVITAHVVLQDKEVRTPALRTYMPEDRLQTLTILYNAAPRAISRSEIEIQSILYKSGEEYQSGEPKPIVSDGKNKQDAIPLLQNLTLGSDIPPGDYTLQRLLIDKNENNIKKAAGSASEFALKIFRAYLGEVKKEKRGDYQTLSFTVIK